MSAPGPYKGLAPFDDSDHDALFFFGRDREHGLIASNLTAARLTLLYGPSGVGKSSVLKAGVVRRLRALPGPLAVVVFDHWREDPGGRLREAVAAAAGSEPEGSLADALEAACARLGGEIYVILDGAEEYFVYHGDEDEPGTFAADFPAAVTRPGLRAYFLLSLREDALAELDRFKPRVPALFANSLRLEHLDREAARDAIVGPIEQYNRMTANGPVAIEPKLVEAVLDQVATGKVELGQAGRGAVRGAETDDRVETPFLSLVMERLWEAEQTAGSRALRLETLEQLGGAEQIVRDHLDHALEALPPESQETAAEVFNHLVTPSGTKIAHGLADLADYAGVSEAELAPVLQALASDRILRPVAGTDGSARYEIFHDVLGGAVLSWRSGWAAERQLARERLAARRRIRRLLALVVIALIAVGAMVAVTIFALSQRSEARTEARHAIARELSASALSQLSIDPELSLLLAVEAARREPTRDVEGVLRRALVDSRVRAVLRGGGRAVRTVLYSHDGKLILTAGDDGNTRIFDVRGNLVRVLKHGGPVTTASFSPDGALAVSAGADGTAAIWRLSTGQRLRVLAHGSPITSASFSADGRLLATGGVRTVAVWDLASGRRLRLFVHDRTVKAAIFGSRSRVIVTGSGREARVFDVGSGRLLRTLEHRGLVTSAAFSPDGTVLATGSADKAARLWDPITGRLLYVLRDHRGQVSRVAFSPRGRLLVTACTDGAARVWRVATGSRVSLLGGHTNAVTSALFAANGKWVITASGDRTVRIWKAGGHLLATLVGHRESVIGAVFSPDDRSVATASEDGTARIWDPGTAAQLDLLGRASGAVEGASFSRDGRRAVGASDDGTARIWDTRTRRLLLTLRHQGVVESASFSPDRRLVATASADRTAVLWRAKTGARLAVLRHPGSVDDIAFSPDGTRVATATAAGTAAIWRTDTGARLHVLRHRGVVVSASFGAGERLVVTASEDGTARIWDARRGTLLNILRGHRKALVGASFSPDGLLVLTASKDATARIWDARTGALKHELAGHRGALTSAAFSADGALVVTASADHDGRIWDVGTGRTLHVLRGHFGTVFGASFSPDGRWVVTAGPSTAGLWPTDSGALFAYLEGHDPTLTSAEFSPDGRKILTASRDETVRIFDCDICADLDGLVALAEARLARTGRTLTPTERKRYLQG